MPVPAQNAASSPTGTATAVREQSVRILVTLEPAAGKRVARCCQDGQRTRCVVRPANGAYLPAVLTRDTSSPKSAQACLLTIYLADGEAGLLFPPGHRFTIWADVVVGETVQGTGLIGHGTACEQEPPAA